MTYYPDLSPYDYISKPARLQAYNVGWLEKTHSYPTGSTSVTSHERLLDHCRSPVREYLTLGYHTCDFCAEPEVPVWIHRGDKRISLGNGEIRVIGLEAVYAAPTLIYHYVTDHDYLPPEEFVEAVLSGPLPNSDEHNILCKMLEGKFRAPDLSPEVQQRLFRRGGATEQELTTEELSQLLDGARSGSPLTLDQLAQLLRTYRSQLHTNLVLELLLNTHIKHKAGREFLQMVLERYCHKLDRVLSLDEIVQLYQARSELAEPWFCDAFSEMMLGDLKAGNWHVRAPLLHVLKEYAQFKRREIDG